MRLAECVGRAGPSHEHAGSDIHRYSSRRSARDRWRGGQFADAVPTSRNTCSGGGGGNRNA